jgi:multicomponent K+:H+ antiporter subunit D
VLPQATALWTAVLAAGLLATVALARAGSRMFWKSQPRPEGEAGVLPAGAAPAESAAIVAVAAVLLLLAVFAAPAQRYAAAAAAQLRAPAGYVTAVLLARPVPSPAAVNREPAQ